MSIMASLDLLAEEIFGEFGFNTLTEYQQKIIIELHKLEDTPKCLTDLLIK